MPKFHFHLSGKTEFKDEQGEICSTIDAAKAYADDVAAEVGRNKRWSEIRGRFIRVTDEDGKEIYRTPLTNCF